MGAESNPAALLVFVIGALLFATLVLRTVLDRNHVPALVAYILLGLGLGALDGRTALLGDDGALVIDTLGKVGIVALLFKVGLESDVEGLQRKLGESTPIWIGSIGLAGGLGFFTAYTMLSLDLLESLFIGVAATATSVGVSVSVWESLGVTASDNGQRLLDVAEMDDISGIAMMALLFAIAPLLQGTSGESLGPVLMREAVLFLAKLAGFAALCWLLGRFVAHRFTEYWRSRMSRADLTIFVAAVGIVIAATSEWIGLSLAVGALFAGFIFSRDRASVEESHSYRAFLDVFEPFFFISIGFNFSPEAAASSLGLAVPLLLAAVAGKFIGTALPAVRAAGVTGAVILGVSMVPRAEISMIIMERGREQNFVSDAVFGAMLVVAIVTSVLAPLVLRPLMARWPQGRERAG